jgi:hypothetical protein
MATTNAIITARKGKLENIPTLLPGELYLATDHQRVFMGQEPITGVCDTTASTNTTAIVEFTSGNDDVIDMDLMVPLNNYTYSIKINPDTDNIDKPGSVIAFTDSKASFPHGLVDTGTPPAARLPTTSDVFVLYYNKEVGYHAEAFPNPTQEISFTASASGVAQATGIEFLCENKESAIIEYTLSHEGTPLASRRGTLSILLDSDNNNVPTTSSIKDEFDISTGTIPVEFSLTNNSTDKFILNFKTTDIVNTHTFTYVQKSFK